MAAKTVWRICHQCMERFVSADMRSLDKLVELHYLGDKCMGQKQLALTFNRDTDRNAWVKK